MIKRYRWFMARFFAGLFFLISLLLIMFAIYQLIVDFRSSQLDIINSVVRCINTLIVALAMFELGVGISKEYSNFDEEVNIFNTVSRTITRFISTVSIALALEALIMTIKYSQLDLAGNLYYPVGILIATGILLLSLGILLKYIRPYVDK